MKFNDRLDLEQTLLATALYDSPDSELAPLLRQGLDESLFSGVRIKIARMINAKIKEGLDFESISRAVVMQCEKDAVLSKECDEILSHSSLFGEKGYLWLVKELKGISILQETQKKLSKTDLSNKAELTQEEMEDAYEMLGKALGKINDLDDEGDEGEGLAEGSFINIAGGSFAGKTTFTLELLKSMAQSEKVCFFSYEMYEKILIRKFKFASWDVLKNIQIYQDGAQIDKIAARIRKLSKKGYKIFAIDSRMKIRVSNEKASEYEKNNEISSKLSELTRTLGVIVILINQISEADLKAGRNSLKGSGDQVYDSDMIIYLKATTNDRKEVVKREFEMAKDRIGERLFKVNIPDFYKKEPQEVYFNEELAV